MKRVVPLLLTMAILAASAPAGAEPADPQVVKAELLANVSAVKPGGTFMVAVRLTLEPGWHVYWINPGDSGVATKVKFEAPEGFELADVQFPVPIRFEQPGNAIGYGYEREVLLTAKVKAPADSVGGSQVTIRAEVSWLTCKDVCLPGRERMTITLPVSRQPAVANDAIFLPWAARFPSDKEPAIKSVRWGNDPARGISTLTVEWSNPPRDAELYPGADEAVEVEKIEVAVEGNVTRATVYARILPDQEPAAETLPALLAYTDAAGRRRGLSVAIPLGTPRATSAAP